MVPFKGTLSINSRSDSSPPRLKGRIYLGLHAAQLRMKLPGYRRHGLQVFAKTLRVHVPK